MPTMGVARGTTLSSVGTRGISNPTGWNLKVSCAVLRISHCERIHYSGQTFPTASKYGIESKSSTMKSSLPLDLIRRSVSLISSRSLSWTCRFFASSQRVNINCRIGQGELQNRMLGKADRPCCGLVTGKHYRPRPQVSTYYLSGR